MSENIDSLFPRISSPPSSLSPASLPGVSHKAGLSVLRTLKDNHVRWHAYLNELGFHNHTSHHLLASYSLGASPALIEATYQRHVAYMKQAITEVEPITPSNFYDHFGETKFYNSYREFFAAEILKKGAKAVLEDYFFSQEGNVVPSGPNGAPPRLLNRLLAGLVHPLIHAGYGLEFGLPGLLAEGLAQAATHPVDGMEIMPFSRFDNVTVATRAAPPLSFPATYAVSLEQLTSEAQNVLEVHALEILGRIVKDDGFDPAPLEIAKLMNPIIAFNTVTAAYGDKLVKFADEWCADGSDPAAKLVELCWLNTVIYGVSGWTGRATAPGGGMNADFFLMHLVTSVIFMPSYAAYLSPTSLSLLMRTYFSTSLAWYIARGRPSLFIAEFFEFVTARPTEPGVPRAAAAEGTLDSSDLSPNPWLPIIQTALQHNDDHVAKLQRALVHCAGLLGTTPAGTFQAAADAGLAGAEFLDGTLFVRVAGLTADRLGWMREGQADAGWDRHGLFAV